MSFKIKKYFCAFFEFCAFCAFLWLFSFSLHAEVSRVDKIAAVVNREIITRTDIDKAILLYPLFREKEESDSAFYLSVLQDLIDYKVVYLEYSDEIELREEDYADVQTSIIKKVGSYDQLLRLLKQYDMQWQDFKEFIKEKVAYEKVVKNKLQIRVNINFEEIETFYNNRYLPQQRRLRLKPKTLIEMAPLIENHLKKSRADERLAPWLKEIIASFKIENKLLVEQLRNKE
ncbi:MAG: hypothetical protein GY950_11650 [bacterium]|nr:hypothetical protein [bacterium]